MENPHIYRPPGQSNKIIPLSALGHNRLLKCAKLKTTNLPMGDK